MRPVMQLIHVASWLASSYVYCIVCRQHPFSNHLLDHVYLMQDQASFYSPDSAFSTFPASIHALTSFLLYTYFLQN